MTATVVMSGRDPARGVPVEVAAAGERIARVTALPEHAVPQGLWLIPGLVDLQINGFAGTDLNAADPDVSGVARLVRELHSVGVTRFCPTVCTQSREHMTRALRALAMACRSEPQVAYAVPGVHVEGPYISPEDGPRGAHPREHVRPPDWEEFEAFQEAAEGRIRIVTLAPEAPGAIPFIGRLVASGVIAAIGHTAASPEIIRAAVAAGARLSTHLGNGSHALLPRHPNYIWEQLAADELSASIIADGHHLPSSVIKAFVRAKGVERIILVSDAVALAGMPPGEHAWLGQRVVLTADQRINLAGTPYLAGSALDLVSALGKVMSFAGVTLAEAVAMASTNPALLLGVEAGALEEGAPADLVLLRQDQEGRFEVLQTVVSGETVCCRTPAPPV